jgi:hypothetical protein
MLASTSKIFKDFFLGKFIDKELEDYIKSKNPSSPEQIDQLTKEFWAKKIQGRYY